MTYEDFNGFGLPVAGSSAGSPFGYGGGNGCQSDADAGLILMGHRYYDPRTGRFITQDPAGSGDNWYAYANNDPVNSIDPSGLSTGLPGTLGAPDQHYSGSFGSDPFELFGEQTSTGNSQMGTGQGGAQQTQGLATPSAALGFFISQGMMHPAPIIIDGWILSMGYGAELLLGAHKYTVSGGLAIDLSTHHFEVTATIGHYNGFGLIAGSGPYIGLGVGTLGGYNGFSSGYNLDAGEFGGVAYDYNGGYKGITYSPGFLSKGLAAGAFMGIPNGTKGTIGGLGASTGGSNTFPGQTYRY